MCHNHFTIQIDLFNYNRFKHRGYKNTGSSHLKIEVFREIPANRERQEVTWSGPWRQVCRLRFTFVRLDHAAEVRDLRKGFLHPKTSEFHVCEEIKPFCSYWLRILFQKNVILKTMSQLKIEVRGWMKTNTAAASFHPRILSPKYAQMGS